MGIRSGSGSRLTVPCFVVAAALPSVETVQQERFMMMRAGVNFSDWRLMTNFQRKDFLARRTVAMSQLEKRMKKANSLGDTLGFVVAKVMGFF